MPLEHEINIIANISDVERKVATIREMLNGLSAQQKALSQAMSKAQPIKARSGGSTSSAKDTASEKQRAKAVDETASAVKQLTLEEEREAKVQELRNRLTEAGVHQLETALALAMQYQRVMGQNVVVARKYMTDLNELVALLGRMGDATRGALVEAMPDVMQSAVVRTEKMTRIIQDKFERLRDIAKAAGRDIVDFMSPEEVTSDALKKLNYEQLRIVDTQIDAYIRDAMRLKRIADREQWGNREEVVRLSKQRQLYEAMIQYRTRLVKLGEIEKANAIQMDNILQASSKMTVPQLDKAIRNAQLNASRLLERLKSQQIVAQVEFTSPEEQLKQVQNVLLEYERVRNLTSAIGEDINRFLPEEIGNREYLLSLNKQQLATVRQQILIEKDAARMRQLQMEQADRLRDEEKRDLNEALATERLRAQIMRQMVTYQSLLTRQGKTRAASIVGESIRSGRLEANLEQRADIQELQRISASLSRSLAEQQFAVNNLSPVQQFKARFSKIASWMGSVWSLFGVITLAERSVQTISEIEKAMTDLRRVMDESTTDFGEMRDAIFDLSVAFGQLPENVGKAMFLFARQGKDQAETIELTKTALMAVNIAEMDLEQAVEWLTAATLQWNMEAKDSIKLLDAWNEVSNKNAVGAEDLAEAFSHTSTMARNLGLDIHELNALITILAANTGKKGGEIGRSLAFAFNRAYSPEVQGALQSVLGTSVFEAGTGNLRDFSAVLNEIASAWGHLSDAEKKAIAEAFGSARHVQDMMILFENLNEQGLKVASESMNSFGSAARENAKYMQTLERSATALLSSLKELAVTLGDSGILAVLQTGIDVAKGALGIFNQLHPAIKQMAMGVLVASLAGKGLEKVFGPLPKVVGVVVSSLKDLGGTLLAFASTGSGVTGVLAGIINGLKAFGAAIVTALGPWGALVAGLLAAVGIYQAWKRHAAEATVSLLEQAKATNELADTVSKRYSAILELQKRIEAVERASQDEIDVTKEKEKIYSDFNALLPGVVANYDQLKERIGEITKQQDLEVQRLRTLAAKEKKQYEEYLRTRIERIEKDIKDQEALMEKARSIYFSDNRTQRLMTGLTAFLPKNFMANAEMNLLAIKALVLDVLGFEKEAEYAINQMESRWHSRMGEWHDDIERQREELKQLQEQLNGLTSEVIPAFASDGRPAEKDPRWGEYIYQINEFIEKHRELSSEMQQLTSYISNQVDAMNEFVGTYREYFQLTGQGLGQYLEAFVESTAPLDELNEKISSVGRTMLEQLDSGAGWIHKTQEEYLKDKSVKAYYEALNQVVEAEEYFSRQIEDRMGLIEKAYDLGILKTEEYILQLNKLREVNAFEEQRKQIREMMEELDSGMRGAYKDYVSDLLKGEEDAVEKFANRINEVRSEVLASGISNWITNSDYFKSDIARQQNALAYLFGGTPDDYKPMADRQFEILKQQLEVEQDIRDALVSEKEEDSAYRRAMNAPSVSRAQAERELRGLGLMPPPDNGSNNGDASGGILGALRSFIEGVKSATSGVTDFVTALGNAHKELENPEVPQEEINSAVSGVYSTLIATLSGVSASMLRLDALVTNSQEKAVTQARQFATSLESLFSNLQAILPKISTQDVIDTRADYSDLRLSDVDIDLIAKMVAAEAGNQSLEGQAAVAAVILNRLKAEGFPNTVEGVLYQKNQFSSVANGAFDRAVPTKENYEAVLRALSGYDPTGGATYFMNPRLASSGGAGWQERNTQVYTQIGDHQFRGTEAPRTVARPIVELPSATKKSSPLDGLIKTPEEWAEFLVKQQVNMSASDAESFVEDAKKKLGLTGDNIKVVASSGGVAILAPLAIFRALRDFALANNYAWASGGYTGSGSVNDIAGYVHKGEWVMPAWMVEKYPDMVAHLEQIRKRGYKTGGLAEGSMEFAPVTGWGRNAKVEASFSAADREALQAVAAAGQELSKQINEGFKKPLQEATKVIIKADETMTKVEETFSGVLAQQYVTETVSGFFKEGGMPAPIADPLGKAAGYFTRGIFEGFGLFQRLAAGFAVLNFFRQLRKEFEGATLSQILGLDVLLGANSQWGFSSGGFTSPGNSNEIAGYVHKGEWVAPAWMVRKYPELIERMEHIRKRGFAIGGYTDTAATQLKFYDANPGSAPTTKIIKLLEEIKKNTDIRQIEILYNNPELAPTNKMLTMIEQLGEPQAQAPGQDTEQKTLGERLKEILFGPAFGKSEQQEFMEYVASKMPGDEAMAKATAEFLQKTAPTVFGQPLNLEQMKGVFDVLYENQALPTQVDFTEMADYWARVITEKAQAFAGEDKRLYEQLQGLNLNIQSFSDAMKDPKQIANAIYKGQEIAAQTGSSLAGQFGMVAGMVHGTGLELQLQEAFSKMGITNKPTDVISGLGYLIGGMSQNARESGTGIVNMLSGLSMMTGVGAAWMPVVTPLLNLLFGSKQPREKAKEAEKIGNVRHFIQSGEGFTMADRFYLSGRYANLLSGRSDTSRLESGQVFTQTIEKVEINVSGASDPKAVAQEVRRQLSEMPRTYSRELRRGITRV